MIRRCCSILILAVSLQSCCPSGKDSVNVNREADFMPLIYEAVKSQTTPGSSIFFYPHEGVTDVGYRQPGRFKNLGAGDGIYPCILGRSDCYLYQGWPPILASPVTPVPKGYVISNKESNFDPNCADFLVLGSDGKSTKSTVCVGLGVVEFSFIRKGEVVEHYVLKGQAGFFG